ncbi:glyoxalase [Candidatus Saccharibacteria bacterium TM7i]|nr:glyoxalase [Candidatus Saccharibacteria bacterium TM7i]
MRKQVFINLPVSDLGRSKMFYEKLGFTNNPDFTDENAAAMVWSDEIYVMLLTHDFYKKFIGSRQVADAATQSGVLLALTMDSPAAVQKFADTAKENGGDCYKVDMGMPENEMFGYEVTDPDGNHWEPLWMSFGGSE